MKKIMIVALILFLSQYAFAFDYRMLSNTMGFDHEFQLDKYAKMYEAKNQAGIDDAVKNAKLIKSGSGISVDRTIYENDDMIVGKFIVEGYKDFLYAILFKKKLIKNDGQPNNAATDVFLKPHNQPNNSATDAILGKPKK